MNWQESLCVAYLRGMTPSQRKAFLKLAEALLYSKDTASAIYLALFRYYQTLDDTGKTALLDWADAFVQEKNVNGAANCRRTIAPLSSCGACVWERR